MFDKNVLNNQITTHKNSVKRAKISVINKLVKKCRKLEKLNEATSDNKFKHKLDRITSQISAVKKLNCLHTLKNAILFEENPYIVITNGNAPVEVVAEMLIFANKTVREFVDRLKITFNLNENNPSWKEYFQKAIANKAKKSTLTKKSKPTKRASICKMKAHESALEIDGGCSNIVHDNNNTIKLAENTKTKINEKSNKHDFVDEKFISQPDPFFTTQNGQNYMSTVYVENTENIKDKFNKENPFNNKTIAKKKKSFEVNSHLNMKTINTSKNKNFKDRNIDNLANQQREIRKNKTIIFEEFSANNNECNGLEIYTNEKDNLKSSIHPSWQAKQKMKPIIQEFKGQKIIFDD